MSIQTYLKEIGRGKDGARALTRVQAAELMGWILDGHLNDLQLGAFCLAMRIKGETAQEMAGFMDALQQRMPAVTPSTQPVVVLPSYNGARRLPVLTPLLALLLAREGLPVLLHGCTTEDSRITAAQVLAAMGQAPASQLRTPQPGELVHVHTRQLHPALADLLDVRAAVGLRNPAHSLVKHFNPLAAGPVPALVVGCFTHPEYSVSMAATHAEAQSSALLLRGMEGEPVADPRRLPAMRGIVHGQLVQHIDAQTGSIVTMPELPTGLDAAATAAWTQDVLDGRLPVPATMALQMQTIAQLLQHIAASGVPA